MLNFSMSWTYCVVWLLCVSVSEALPLTDLDPDLFGEIQSPLYPGSYPPNLRKRWDLSVPEGHRISLTFTHLDLEPSANCYYDSVSILYKEKVLGRFCGLENSADGHHPGYGPILSPGNTLTLLMQTDDNNPEHHQNIGFSAHYQAIADGVPGVADVVLSCVLVQDGAAHSGGGEGVGGGGFSRSPATLVLRDVPAGSDQSLEALTPFVPPTVPDPDLLIIEATVSSPDIPNSDVLLHADCNGQEVTCELSPFSPDQSLKSPDQAFIMVSLSVDGVDFGTSLILRTIKEEQITQRQSRLGLPLSPSGTVASEVVMVIFSHVKSLSGILGEEVQLPCGFKQQDPPLAPDVHITWRLQHRGRGHKVLELKTNLEDSEGSPLIHTERTGAWVSPEQVVSEGNASLTLSKLKVDDEGTYICTVSIGYFHAQQVMQLNIMKLPEVSLSEDKLVLKSAKTLVCYSSKYYPLDAEIEWFSLGPDDPEPVVFPGKASLSGHRHHGDGTFSHSSQLKVPATVSPGTKITCTVSHPALDSPRSVSVIVETPEPDSYWGILGFLIITVIFFLQVMK